MGDTSCPADPGRRFKGWSGRSERAAALRLEGGSPVIGCSWGERLGATDGLGKSDPGAGNPLFPVDTGDAGASGRAPEERLRLI